MNQNDRPQFFEGQYLGAADLAAGVDYTRRRTARHELGAHTWGIAAGLELVETALGSGAVQVTITPGYAWDGYGRPIVVLAPERLSNELFRNLTADTAPEGDIVKIWVRYDEGESSNPQPGFEVCQGDQHARVVETFAVEVGEQDTSHRVVINARAVEAKLARQASSASAPQLPDETVPYQEIPDSGALPRWPILLGYVRWFKQGNAPGYLKARDDSGGTKPRDSDQIRALRHYVGVVAEEVLAADGALRLRDRNKAPSTHYVPPTATTDPAHPPDNDLLWVEGHARVEGDARLVGGKLEWRNNAGEFGGVPMLARRNESNGFNGKSLELGFSAQNPAPSGKQRVVFGPINVDANGQLKDIDPKFVVRDDGKVGINEADPQQMLVLKSPKKTRLEIGYTSPTLPWSVTGGTSDEASFVINQQSDGSDQPDADLALMRDRRKRLVLGDKNTIISSQGSGNIRFHLNLEETGDQEVMRVTEDGKVAIGVSSASRPLHVEPGEIHSGGNGGGFSFANRSTGSFVDSPGAGERWVWYATGGTARLWSGGDKLAATPAGNVGIGTSSPAAKLDVRGSVKLGSGGNYFALGALADWRMVAGRVSDSGGVLSGPGFTSSRLAEGHYRVTFSSSFDSTPVIVATLVDTPAEDNALTVLNASASSFEVWSKDVAGQVGADPQDSAFNFIAVGPRS
jgi:hypothetical protein